MELNFVEIMSNLAIKHKAFYSEADFQFALGWELQGEENVERVYFEVPFQEDENDKRGRLDLLVKMKNGSEIPVELKYFHSDFEHNGIMLPKHNDSWRSYKFIKDIFKPLSSLPVP